MRKRKCLKCHSTNTEPTKLTKDYCISQKRVNSQMTEIKTSKITKLNVKMNVSKSHKWIFKNFFVCAYKHDHKLINSEMKTSKKRKVNSCTWYLKRI